MKKLILKKGVGVLVVAGVGTALFCFVQCAKQGNVAISDLELQNEVYAPIRLANTVGIGKNGSLKTFANNYYANPVYYTSPEGANYYSNPAYYTSPEGQNLNNNPAHYTSARPERSLAVKGCSKEDPTECESPMIGGFLRVVYKNNLQSVPSFKPLPLPKRSNSVSVKNSL